MHSQELEVQSLYSNPNTDVGQGHSPRECEGRRWGHGMGRYDSKGTREVLSRPLRPVELERAEGRVDGGVQRADVWRRGGRVGGLGAPAAVVGPESGQWMLVV